jgi:hypothetical protein
MPLGTGFVVNKQSFLFFGVFYADCCFKGQGTHLK